MITRLLPYDKLYVVFLGLIGIGLSTGEFIMSVASIALAANWLLEGRFSEKLDRLKKYRYAPVIACGLYGVHLLGLLNTSNFQYGFHDVVLKLPLLSFPIVIGTMRPLRLIEQVSVFYLFVGGLLVSTLISYGVYLGWFSTNYDPSDIRSISIFISHIRLCLLCCLAIGMLFMFLNRVGLWLKLAHIVVALWFFYFLGLIESGTGFVVLFGISLLAIWKVTVSRLKNVGKYALLGSSVVVLGLGAYLIYDEYNYLTTPLESNNPEHIDLWTPDGSPYEHYHDVPVLENGHYVYLHMASAECDSAWANRSTIPLTGVDHRGQELRATLYRYLTSKGKHKNYRTVSALTDDEVRLIEGGQSSVIVTSGFRKKIREIVFEYVCAEIGLNPNGHSVYPRMIYWNTGLSIFKDNVIFGVGTGDVPDAYKAKYIEVDSPLLEENRLRAHNQLITLFVAFGLVGGVLCLLSILLPIRIIELNKTLLALFGIVAVVSFFSDDTFETQAGVTFFAFFYCMVTFQSKFLDFSRT